MLKIDSLKKKYKISNKNSFDALKGVSFNIKDESMVAIIGESGSGKSTLLNLISTVDSPTGGFVEYDNEKISIKKESRRTIYRRDNIGFIFQSFNLIKDLTVIENVELPMEISGVSKTDRRKRALELLELVGLSDQIDKMPGTISGGQKQRVAIARALANNPGLILADEPTGALDEETSIEIMQLLASIAQDGNKVIIVTHDADVAAYCERVITMRDGAIVEDTKQEGVNINKISLPANVDRKLGGLKFNSILKLSSSFRKKLKRNLLISFATAIALSSLLLVNIGKSTMNNHLEKIHQEYGNSSIVLLNFHQWSDEHSEGDPTFDLDAFEEQYQINDYKHLEKRTEYSEYRAISYYDITFENSSILAQVMYPKGIDTFGSKDIVAGSAPKNDNEIAISSDLVKLMELSEEQIIGKEVTLQFVSYSYDEYGNEEEEEITDYTFTISGVLTDSSVRGFNSTIFFTDEFATTFEINSGFPDYWHSEIIEVKDGYANDFIEYIDEINKEYNDGYIYISARRDLTSVMIINELVRITSNVFTVVLAISALVASILILVMSYISILERIKEVGVLRSIGAKKQDIVKIFMFEAFLIGLIAGITSVIFSYSISIIGLNVVNERFTKYLYGTEVSLSSSLTPIFITIVFAIVLSCVSSLISVRRGLKINPAEAIRMK